MSFSQEQIELLMQNYASEEFFCSLSEEEQKLYDELLKSQKRLNFPTISPSVGQFLCFITGLISPSSIFEFGSGYGHSAFWYLLAKSKNLNKVHLTEKREDLETIFNSLSWPETWKEKLSYHQGDAFKTLRFLQEESFDLILVDGTKAEYQDFLLKVHPQLCSNGIVIIDNAFWKGSFLNPDQREKLSSKAIGKLHLWLKKQEIYDVSFLPISDGLFILRKK